MLLAAVKRKQDSELRKAKCVGSFGAMDLHPTEALIAAPLPEAE